MPIILVILLMIVLIAVGKRSRELGFRQYLLILLITVVQVCIFVIYMYTMERPPFK
jgi:hypothetical protein